MAKAKKGKLTIEDALVPVEEQPYEIPENWCWIYLESLCEYMKAGGDKPSDMTDVKTDEFNIPVIANGIQNEGIMGYTSTPIIVDQTVTVSGRGTIGYSIYRDYPYYPVVRLIVLKPNLCLDAKYLKYIFDYFEEEGTGSSIPQLTVPSIKKKNIPLPPLAEQKRIVEQIENLFSKLDEAKEKVSNALDEFENRKGAIMHAAFSGKLTQGWREKNKISDDSWKYVTMGDIAKFHQGVQVPVDEQYDDDSEDRVRFIRIVDYTQGNEAPRYVSKDKATDDTYVLGNEIVMVRYGASAGFVGDNIEGLIANNMFTITVDEEIREYIKLYLRSPHMYKLLNTSGGSSAMPALNFKVVSKIELDIPSHDEIEQIYKVLNPVIEKYEKTESIYTNVIEQIDLMKKSILAKAFRGELGTNIADEESSVELLKKLLNE